MRDTLQNKMTALVTGSAQGLGAQFAMWLAERGHDVVLHYNTSEQAVNALRERIEEDFQVTCYIWRADLKEDVVPGLNQFLSSNKLGIDILVNNVGNFLYKQINQLSIREIRDVMATNFESAFVLCEYFIPRMQEQGYGRVINLTCSGAEGLVYRQNTAFYHYAKSGVHLTTQLWAQKCADSGNDSIAHAADASDVTINSIAPGVLPDSEYKETISQDYWTSYDEVKQAFNYLLDSDPSLNGVNFDLAKGWKPGCRS